MTDKNIFNKEFSEDYPRILQQLSWCTGEWQGPQKYWNKYCRSIDIKEQSVFCSELSSEIDRFKRSS